MLSDGFWFALVDGHLTIVEVYTSPTFGRFVAGFGPVNDPKLDAFLASHELLRKVDVPEDLPGQ